MVLIYYCLFDRGHCMDKGLFCLLAGDVQVYKGIKNLLFNGLL